MKRILLGVLVVLSLSACENNDKDKEYAISAYNYRKGVTQCLDMGADKCKKLRTMWEDPCIDPSDKSNTCEKYNLSRI